MYYGTISVIAIWRIRKYEFCKFELGFSAIDFP